MVSKKRDLTYWTNPKAIAKAKRDASSNSTHTDLGFQWKQDSKKNTSLKEYISYIVKPIFEKAAQETIINQVSVGLTNKKQEKFCYYQPHNYRLYFDFSKENFNPKPMSTNQCQDKKRLVTLVYSHKVKNSKEHEYNNFLGCRIRVKASQVEVTNNLDHKRWYTIKISNKKDISKQVTNITNVKDNQCINALKKFIGLHGGSSNFEILNRMSDDKVMDSNIRKKIPKKMKFRTTAVKKLYNEPNVEYSSPVEAANYMHNMGLEELAPEIEAKLDELKAHSNMLWEGIKGIVEVNKSTADTFNSFATNFLPIHREHAVNIKSHTKVLKNISKGFNKFNTLLSQRRLGEYYQ